VVQTSCCVAVEPAARRLRPTLSLHDALPIYDVVSLLQVVPNGGNQVLLKVRFAEVSRNAMSQLGASLFTAGYKDYIGEAHFQEQDRKSTRLNSSHEWISYAVFCLKKTNQSTD